VLIGKKVALQDIDLRKGRYVAIGNYLCEGQDVFDISEDILAALPSIDFDFEYCLVEQEIYEAGGDKIVLGGGEYNIWSGEADQHSSDTVDDLLENYQGYTDED